MTIQDESKKFKDAKFLSAIGKARTYKHFKRFVENGFKLKDFHKSVYEHLHLHCGFIAHYNLHGFYSVYFDGGDFERFKNTIKNNLDYSEYADINKAMFELLEKN